MNVVIVWIVWLLTFPVVEGYALWRADDKAQPLTYYVRWLMRKSWFFRFMILAGIVWVFLHFAVGLG